MITIEEIKSLIVGPIATVPTPFDDEFEVDYGKMHELTQMWVDEGLVKGRAVLKVAAAMGEGPMLRDDEWPYLLRTVVQAANDKAAIVCGLHYKDTKRTIEDAKRAQDMGAHALQVCPPVFNRPSQDDIFDYFAELSEAIDIGIMVYHTHWLSGGRIEVDTILRMKELKQIASIKWSAPEDVEHSEMSKFADAFSVIANGYAIETHKLGGRGYINVTASAYPAHDLKVWDLLESGNYEEADKLFTSTDDALRDFGAKMDARSGGQARLPKALMDVMGFNVGASRPPSKPINANELAELKDIVKNQLGWPVPN